MARKFVLVFGVILMCIGGWVLINPLGLTSFADLFLTPTGLWVAAVARVAIGVMVWLAASASRMPRTLKVFGALFVIGGVALPVMGLERLQSLAAWGADSDTMVLRAIAVLTVALGAFFVWAVSSPKGER